MDPMEGSKMNTPVIFIYQCSLEIWYERVFNWNQIKIHQHTQRSTHGTLTFSLWSLLSLCSYVLFKEFQMVIELFVCARMRHHHHHHHLHIKIGSHPQWNKQAMHIQMNFGKFLNSPLVCNKYVIYLLKFLCGTYRDTPFELIENKVHLRHFERFWPLFLSLVCKLLTEIYWAMNIVENSCDSLDCLADIYWLEIQSLPYAFRAQQQCAHFLDTIYEMNTKCKVIKFIRSSDTIDNWRMEWIFFNVSFSVLWRTEEVSLNYSW